VFFYASSSVLAKNASEKKVGILIEPSQVRLVTGADDLYTWKVLPQKKHLFSKNISDHSIGAYKELCEGIDSAFEAVPVTTTTFTRLAEYIQETLKSTEVCKPVKFLIPTKKNSLKPLQASFSAKIDELREENENLERELKEWKDQATAESKLREDSEQERNQLRVANQTLQCEL
jgi:DNA repair ATPase RecN